MFIKRDFEHLQFSVLSLSHENMCCTLCKDTTENEKVCSEVCHSVKTSNKPKGPLFLVLELLLSFSPFLCD